MAPDGPDASRAWPLLPPTWPETRASLHMWTQMVGKVRMTLSPPQNHFWHSTLYVTARGDVQSRVPEVVLRRTQRHSHLAHHLRPHMERSAGFRPRGWKQWPRAARVGAIRRHHTTILPCTCAAPRPRD